MKTITNKRKFKSDASISGRLFHDEWTCKFGVIKYEDKALCCICKKVIIARLNHLLQKIEMKTDMDGCDFPAVENHAENIILTEWNSLPNSFETMKRFAVALLTLFGSSYSCESLFSHMNFIQSSTRNRLSSDMSAACVKTTITN